jgi:hypothetical protein
MTILELKTAVLDCNIKRPYPSGSWMKLFDYYNSFSGATPALTTRNMGDYSVVYEFATKELIKHMKL